MQGKVKNANLRPAPEVMRGELSNHVFACLCHLSMHMSRFAYGHGTQHIPRSHYQSLEDIGGNCIPCTIHYILISSNFFLTKG